MSHTQHRQCGGAKTQGRADGPEPFVYKHGSVASEGVWQGGFFSRGSGACWVFVIQRTELLFPHPLVAVLTRRAQGHLPQRIGQSETCWERTSRKREKETGLSASVGAVRDLRDLNEVAVLHISRPCPLADVKSHRGRRVAAAAPAAVRHRASRIFAVQGDGRRRRRCNWTQQMKPPLDATGWPGTSTVVWLRRTKYSIQDRTTAQTGAVARPRQHPAHKRRL